MKKHILFAFVLMLTLGSYAQDITHKSTIKQSLDEFIGGIGMLNDPQEEIRPEDIASTFMNGTYFRFNNNDIRPIDFLNSYSKRVLGDYIINHELVFVDQKIAQKNDTWQVNATLKRASGTNEDFRVKDTDITFKIRYNGIGNSVTILEIAFSPSLFIIRPEWKDEYVFDVKGPGSRNWRGGTWSMTVDSKMRKVKYYGDDAAVFGNYTAVDYKHNAPPVLNAKQSLEIVSGTVRGNTTRRDKKFPITVTQQKLDGTTANKTVYLMQYGKPSVFDFDDTSAAMHQVEGMYSLKYDVGLSYMLTIPGSRVSVGVAVASNFDCFKGLFNKEKRSSNNIQIENNVDINIGNGANSSESEITNGYKKWAETVGGDYSPLLDPNNEAEHFTSRSFFLAQGGIYIFQWLRFDVGFGAARAQNVHYMKDMYNVTKYSYEPTDSSLPPIADVYQYERTGQDNYFRDKTKWSFAIRPAINGQIPLGGGYYENFITIGVGYLYAPNISGGCSLDFTLGYGWNF